MFYYEVLVADSKYRGEKPLTYSSALELRLGHVVSVPMRNRMVTGFVDKKVARPDFEAKAIRHLLSSQPLPQHLLKLAQWLKSYYYCNLGEALRQLAPSKPTLQAAKAEVLPPFLNRSDRLDGDKLTPEQNRAIRTIKSGKENTYLLHGETGSGKTRVYLELAKEVLANGRSIILLTPEIALTAQLAAAAKSFLKVPVLTAHSQLTLAQRKKLWLEILQTSRPIVIVGPRSALFSPLPNPGLIVLDEAHEPAYKQQQAPHYHTARAASQLAALTGAKTLLGTATPSIDDYYLATSHRAVIRMSKLARQTKPATVKTEVIDIKDRANFPTDPQLSKQLLGAIKKTLAEGQQVLIYLNRRGSARLVLCEQCGWQLLCPRRAVPMVYHHDHHEARCHICGFRQPPPINCPKCSKPDLIYKNAGTKTIADSLTRAFPHRRLQRFDSDNLNEERLHNLYSDIIAGKVNILVGTQLLAKGLDLPKLGMVGIVSAETSLALPDYTAEERAFQLLYQVIGRVGRGYGHGKVVIQAYDPSNTVIQAAITKNWLKFYNETLKQRRQFNFPPFVFVLKLVCKRASQTSARRAAENLRVRLEEVRLPVEIVGPTPSFYEHRYGAYYWQLVIKSKSRRPLGQIVELLPANWIADIDPINLL